MPSHHCRACDIGVAEAVTVAIGVGVHCRSQCLRYAYVIHYQAALFFGKHTVHARYGLHQVVAAHGLVNIHGGKRWHVEAREPHVAHDGYLHFALVVLEFACQLFLVFFVAYDVGPFFGVFVAAAHHHLHLFGPFGAQLKHLFVELDGYRA